jgi:phage-related protein
LAVAYTRFEGFRNFVDTVWQGIQQVITRVWEDFIKPVFEQLVQSFNEQIMPALQDLWAAFQEVWPGIQDAIGTAWDFIAPILEKIVEIYIFLYSVILVALIKYWTFVFTKIVEIITWVISVIGPIFAAIVSFITDKIVPAAQGLWEKMKDVWEKVSGAVTTAWDVMGRIFESIKDGIAGVADWVGDKVGAIIGFFGNVGDGIKEAFRAAFNFVARGWNSTVGKLKVPDWSPIGGGMGMPQIPEFNKGGVVPGIQGAPMLAVVHGGEQILRPSEVAGAGAGGGAVYNITINGMVGKDKRDILEFLSRELPRAAATHARSFG